MFAKVEKNEACRRVIEQRMSEHLCDQAPISEDITSFSMDGKEPVDGYIAGFPCQAHMFLLFEHFSKFPWPGLQWRWPPGRVGGWSHGLAERNLPAVWWTETGTESQRRFTSLQQEIAQYMHWYIYINININIYIYIYIFLYWINSIYTILQTLSKFTITQALPDSRECVWSAFQEPTTFDGLADGGRSICFFV